MKRLISLALAAVTLAASLPATFAENALPELTVDPASALYISDGYIYNMKDGCTASELLANFRDRKNVTVTAKDGTALSLTDVIGSDAVVSYEGSNGTSTAKTWMIGDLNGDAQINTKDPAILVRDQAGFSVDLCRPAADVNCDGAVNAKDIATMLKSAAGWDITIAKPEYAGIVAEFDDPGIDYCFDSVLNRVSKANTALVGTKDHVGRMAKNEIETIQLLITSDADRDDMTIEVTPLTNAAGAELEYEFLVGYYYDLGILKKVAGADYSGENTEDGPFVEPIPEYRGEAFKLEKNTSKMFAMRVSTTAETESGLYKAVATLRDKDGKVVKAMEFRMFVWDFVLDETPASASAFELSYSQIYEEYCDHSIEKMNSPEYSSHQDEVMEEWYEYLLKNHLSAYKLPHDVRSEKAEKYMSDPRVTSFCINGAGACQGVSQQSTEDMRSIYARLRQNPEWLDKAYIYTVDEPWGETGMNQVKSQYEWACEMIPEKDFHIVIPQAGNNYMKGWDNGQDIDELEIVYRYSDILCPQTMQFENYVSIQEYKANKSLKPAGYRCTTSPNSWEKYGQVVDRWYEWRQKGDKKMWWYICCSPMAPFANFFRYYQGVDARMVLWQQYFYDVDGLLYWSTILWDKVNKRKMDCDGDGLLLFPGTMFGQELYPVSSVRLEYIRDGFEDFQYLKQLERVTDRKSVMRDYVERLTTDLLAYSEDYTEMESVRDELGFMLESLNGN